jgi:hypothetical protein
MLLLRGAHATTLGFMAVVGRLKFGGQIVSPQHKWLLRAMVPYFLLGYPWAFTAWLNVLVVASIRGRVAVGDGFLVVLSERTSNPTPARRDQIIGGLTGGVLAMIVLYLLSVAASNVYEHPGVVSLILTFTLGPVILSALVRTRRENLSHLKGSLIVNGFVPTSTDLRRTARTAAPAWLAQQHVPVAWVADEGLKRFYEDILSQWNVKGVLVHPGSAGFWGLLRPARYSFRKP